MQRRGRVSGTASSDGLKREKDVLIDDLLLLHTCPLAPRSQPPSYGTRLSCPQHLPTARHVMPPLAPAPELDTTTQQTRRTSPKTRSASRPLLPLQEGRAPLLRRRTRRRC